MSRGYTQIMLNIMKLLYLCLAVLICCCDAYRVLLVFPMPIRSLNILGEGFVRHLHGAGHEITYITAFPLKNKPEKNFHQIDVSKNQEMLSGSSEEYNLTNIMKNAAKINDVGGLQEFALYAARMTFENKAVIEFLADTKKEFDVVIADLYEVEVYSGFSALFNCPMIWSYSMGIQWSVLSIVDGPTNPAYTADYLSTNHPPFTFTQRVEELWTQIRSYLVKRFQTLPKEKALFENVFGPLFKKRGKILPLYKDVVYNASLILANDHHATGNVPATPQNFRFIGGQHITTPNAPLPKDLQALMDNARHGVIYFSLGSTWKSKDIPEQVTEGLLKMFEKLKQTVIWKYEDDRKNVPSNVHIMKWAPQQSILAHPKCLFFITHGGLLSTIETIHAGVPIIGVPIFLDQFVNIKKAVSSGYAVQVDLTFDLPNNLRKAIETMLGDGKYAKRAKELSLIYHDRVVSPSKELVHWVEHVARTHGASHLRSPALLTPFYQKMYLDLVALFVTVLILLKMAVGFAISRAMPKNKIKDGKKRN